jgi:hypothetical protein
VTPETDHRGSPAPPVGLPRARVHRHTPPTNFMAPDAANTSASNPARSTTRRSRLTPASQDPQAAYR